MSTNEERAWADGYGTWHAVVPAGTGAGLRALALIADALAEREHHLDVSRLNVRLLHRHFDGMEEYVETWTALEWEFEPDDRVEIGWILQKRGPSHVATVLRDVKMALEHGQPVRVVIGEKP